MSPTDLSPGKLETYIQNTKQLEKIFHAMSEIIQIADAQNGLPVYVNKSVLHLLNYSEEQIKEMGVQWRSIILHPSDAEILKTHIANWKTLKKDELTRIIYRMKTSSGEWHVIESISTVLTTLPDGSADKIIGLTRDITGQQLSAAEFDTAQVEHRCKNCRKLLGIEKAKTATIEVKCGRCGEINPIPLHTVS
jgi:PAS domain S-box-containing protein